MMIRRPTISPLFPYTTLFRSREAQSLEVRLPDRLVLAGVEEHGCRDERHRLLLRRALVRLDADQAVAQEGLEVHQGDRKSTRLNSSHMSTSYAVFCLKKKTSC